MTSSAAALLRLLLQRAGEDRHRILLSGWSSTDWQSLTFVDERHEAEFVLRGPDAAEFARNWTDGLADAEFDLPKGFVAEIALCGEPVRRDDGSVAVGLKALTLAD
jgi:hypothetical protein